MAGLYHPLVLYGSLIALLGFAIIRFYSAFTNPLFNLPGPWYSKWTRLPLKYHILEGNRVYYVHALHQRYGPIVRLSSDEVSLADIQSAKTIYRVGGPYLKMSFYKAFTGTEAYGNLFVLTDKDVHNHNRKMQSHQFSEKWIRTMEPFIKDNVQRAIGRIREDVERKGYSDIFEWMTFMATDVIGEASFGDSFLMLEAGKVGKLHVSCNVPVEIVCENLCIKCIFRPSSAHALMALGQDQSREAQRVRASLGRAVELSARSQVTSRLRTRE